MKKRIFLAALLVAVLAFSAISCKKEDKERCWKVTAKSTEQNVTESVDFYAWGTEAAVNTAMEALKADSSYIKMKEVIEQAGGTVSLEKEEATQYATQNDCLNQNADLIDDLFDDFFD